MNKLIEQITQAVRACGDEIKNTVRGAVKVDEKEGEANFVTNCDRMVQEKLEKRLLAILPEGRFMGEEADRIQENADSIQRGYLFIVDPIDGTTNFIKDYHISMISVGLLKDGEPYVGVIYNPYLDEMYTAEKGKGAFLNGKPIHVSSEPLSNGLVLFGAAPYYEELNQKSFELVYDYFKKSLDLRRSGSAAFDLCCIAAGRAELFFELRLSPWDFAAGALLVTEAGGKITTFEGKPLTFYAPCSVKATNGIAE